MTRKRVMVIGIDGATFDLIEPWVAQGDLPNLARLMAEGSRGRLASTIQPTTAPAWTTFMTGVNQGKHGLYDFVRRRAGGYNLEVTNGTLIGAPTLFDIASQQGLRVISVNIPYTSPPRPVNGVVVGGPFASTMTRELVYPSSFYERLQQLVPGYFILPDYNPRAPDPLRDYAQKLLTGIGMRERLSTYLMQEESWDLFAVVFMATDEAQHTFWHHMAASEEGTQDRYGNVIRSIYQRIDQAVGTILNQAEGDNTGRETVVLLLSDHGAGPFYWMINLNRWLAEAGYLRFRTEGINPLRRWRSNAISRIAQAYRRYLPAQARATIRARLGIQRFDRFKGEFESALLTSSVAWEQTRAYALGAGGNIYINLAGREPAGVVAPGAEQERLCQEISDALMTLSDPDTQRPVVARVYRREELYNGPFLDQAPDLIIQWADYGYWGRGRYDSRTPVFEAQRRFDFSDQPLTGSHRPDGILIVRGPGVRSGAQIEGAHLWDLAPTILSLLGIAPPPDLDGQLLRDILVEGEAERLEQAALQPDAPEPGEASGFTPEEEEKISEHLRSLGYL